MHSKKIISAVFIVTLGAACAFAHDGIEHVMGILNAKTDTSVTVKTVKDKLVIVLLDPGTTYSYNDKVSTLGALKLGDRVVVNAKDDSADKLHAVSIRWGANSTSHADHDDHTKP